MIRELRWSGAANIDGIRDRRNGEDKLLEINARFGSSHFGATAAGVNLPDVLVRLARNETVAMSSPKNMRFYTGGIGVKHFLGLREPRLGWSETMMGQIIRDSLPELQSCCNAFKGNQG